MSKQAALEFREYLKANPDAEGKAREILRKVGRVDNVSLGREYGFDFTEDEARAAWAEVTAKGQLTGFELEMVTLGNTAANDGASVAANDDDELTDLELEMVSGGGKYPCNTDDTRFAADANMRAMDRGGNDP